MKDRRRGFLRQLSVGAIGVFAGPGYLHASSQQQAEPWLQGLSGKHRQFFDVAAHAGGNPLQRANAFLNVYGENYGLKDTDLNVVFGAHGSGLAFVLGDAIWSHYHLGTQYSIVDPVTGTDAVRNVYSGLGSTGVVDPPVTALQKRGVRFLACMQTIGRLSRALSAKTGETEAAVKSALVGGLLPGVTPVPAMIVAASRAQESGLTYVYLG